MPYKKNKRREYFLCFFNYILIFDSNIKDMLALTFEASQTPLRGATPRVCADVPIFLSISVG
jgi:hypothetical protein